MKARKYSRKLVTLLFLCSGLLGLQVFAPADLFADSTSEVEGLNSATGYWKPIAPMRANGRKLLKKMRDSYPMAVRAEVGEGLAKLGLFAREIKIAQTDERLTLVADDRQRLSLAISKKEPSLVGSARSRMKRRKRQRAYLREGMLTVELSGKHSRVLSTFAKVPKEKLLCQAIEIKSLHGRQRTVLKHVLEGAQNKQRLPNPWKEPPSILPPPEKRRNSPLQEGAKELFSLGSMLLPIL